MEIMIEFIVILLVMIIIPIPFLFPFVYDSDWFENYFWEDKKLFQRIMNYISKLINTNLKLNQIIKMELN